MTLVPVTVVVMLKLSEYSLGMCSVAKISCIVSVDESDMSGATVLGSAEGSGTVRPRMLVRSEALIDVPRIIAD